MFAQRRVLTPDGVMLMRGNQIGPGKRSVLKLHERIHKQEAKKAAALVERLTSEDNNDNQK